MSDHSLIVLPVHPNDGYFQLDSGRTLSRWLAPPLVLQSAGRYTCTDIFLVIRIEESLRQSGARSSSMDSHKSIEGMINRLLHIPGTNHNPSMLDARVWSVPEPMYHAVTPSRRHTGAVLVDSARALDLERGGLES